MFIRAYLRASTSQQDASRAKQQLIDHAANASHKIASFYVENESGASLQRPELFRLLDDCQAGDVLLIEQVDRLSRLNDADWKTLRTTIESKGVNVVALDLPTSHQFLKQTANDGSDAFTARMLAAINTMMLDMLAAVARKDYEDRRRRQAEGIATAKSKGVYNGRPVDAKLHAKIKELLDDGKSIRGIANILECSPTTVQKVKASIE